MCDCEFKAANDQRQLSAVSFQPKAVSQLRGCRRSLKFLGGSPFGCDGNRSSDATNESFHADYCGTRFVMATPRLRWACPSGAKDSPLAQSSPKKSASAGLVPAGPRFPVKREALVAENARAESPAIQGECQTIVINLGSTPPSGVEASDFLIFSFLVNNLLLRWGKPSGGLKCPKSDG